MSSILLLDCNVQEQLVNYKEKNIFRVSTYFQRAMMDRIVHVEEGESKK